MNGVFRALKFQLLSYLQAFIIAISVGIAVGIAFYYIPDIANIEPLVVNFSDALVSGIVLSLFVGIVILVVHIAFTLFFEDFTLLARLGITRNNFLKSTFIFLIIVITVYSLLLTAFIYLGFEMDTDIALIESMFDETDMEEFNFLKEKVAGLEARGPLYVFSIIVRIFLQILPLFLLLGIFIFALRAKGIILVGLTIFLFQSPIISGLSESYIVSILIFLLSYLIVSILIKKFDKI